MKYFTITKETTKEDLQQQYRSWAKKLHPDMGGNQQDFNILQDELNQAKSIINQPAKTMDINEIKEIAVSVAKKHLSTMFNGLLNELGVELKKRL
jgi:DnaJ-class molecular chaperone